MHDSHVQPRLPSQLTRSPERTRRGAGRSRAAAYSMRLSRGFCGGGHRLRTRGPRAGVQSDWKPECETRRMPGPGDSDLAAALNFDASVRAKASTAPLPRRRLSADDLEDT
jgi:hypothetical protein